MDDFKARVFKGFKWSFLGQISNQLFSLTFSLLLARLLVPELFGLMAMVNVLIGFFSILSTLGLDSAIIQKQEVSNRLLSSVFWLNLFMGIVLFLAFYSLSSFIADFYNERELTWVTQVLALNFIFFSFSIVPRAVLAKELKFKFLMITELGSVLVSGTTAVMLALNGYGIIALIAQSLLQSFVVGVTLFYGCGWKPRLTISTQEIKGISRFSSFLLFDSTLGYWVKNLDNLLVGKYLGSNRLGVYSKSFSFTSLPLDNVTTSVGKVLFPALAMIKNDHEKIKRTYLKVLTTVSMLTFPIAAGIFVLADKFVLVFLTPDWEDMIPIMRIFSFLAASKTMGTFVGNLFISQERTDLLFKYGTIRKLFIIAAVIIGLSWNIEGVAIFYTVSRIVSLLFIQKIAGDLIGLRLRNVLLAVTKNLIGSILMATGVYLLDFLFLTDLDLLARLICQVLAGIALYIMYQEFIKDHVYLELKKMLVREGKDQ